VHGGGYAARLRPSQALNSANRRINPSFRLTPVIDGLQVTVLFAGTVLPYTVATLIPIWRAAIADPDTVMRL